MRPVSSSHIGCAMTCAAMACMSRCARSSGELVYSELAPASAYMAEDGLAALRHGVMGGGEYRRNAADRSLARLGFCPELRHTRTQEIARRGDLRLGGGDGREHGGSLAESRSGIHHRFVSRQLDQRVDRNTPEA